MPGDYVKNIAVDSSGGDKTLYIPSGSTTYGNAYLRGMQIAPSSSGAADDDRHVEFKDKKDDTILFKGWVNKNTATANRGSMLDNIMLPSGGIRFENGIKLVVESDFVERISVFYTGGDGEVV